MGEENTTIAKLIDINKLPRTCVHEKNIPQKKMVLLCSSNGNLVSNLPIFFYDNNTSIVRM